MTKRNFTQIDNFILEDMQQFQITSNEYKVIMAVLRYTLGFHRGAHAMSVSFLEKATYLDRKNIRNALSSLRKHNVIKIIESGGVNGNSNILSFNKNFNEWTLKKYKAATRGHITPSNEESGDCLGGELPPVLGGELPPVLGGKTPPQEIKVKENKKETTRQNKFSEDNTYFKMATYFHERVSKVANDAGISHLIKKSNMQTWADDMRKLVELDQVDKRLAKDVMDWVTEDSFWRTNVLSAKKLREKFMELAIKMNAEKKPVQQKPKPQYDHRDKEIAFQQWMAGGNQAEDFNWETGEGNKV